MTEMSPFTELHPPHLDWAFRSERGEFRLRELENGQIELAGTTWFHTVMEPNAYWGAICDYLVGKIHRRVLDHIKTTVEFSKPD